MKSLKRFKTLKASSIMESVIAIAIISICALVALMIYVNVVKQNSSASYYEAIHKVNYLKNEAFLNKDYQDNSYIFKGYKIEKTVILNKDEKTAQLKWKVVVGSKTKIFNSLISYNEDL
ncbi:hypothetical protein [uncultured Lacinutrix sp.]|uniref:hypothetical protein n=1 Tax=uncultured Lacinutrix sp. TaxID=574032 RepID=UPI00262BA414|nr:hypothetical protein [uncultured Lacinutrix sp.]